MKAFLTKNLAESERVKVILYLLGRFSEEQTYAGLLKIGPADFDRCCMNKTKLFVDVSRHVTDPEVIPAILD